MMEGFIKLDNGKFLKNDFGKYQPDLCFICPKEEIVWESKPKKDFNLGDGSVDVIRGKFFTSKKGTKCFEIRPDGYHYLIRDDWGGSFNSYRGGVIPNLQGGALYYRRASSNGGGSGYDYCIVPVEWKKIMSIDDI